MRIPLRNHWDFFVYLRTKLNYNYEITTTIIIHFCFVFFTSFSQIQTINTIGMTFTPDTLSITLGDTIEFGPLGYQMLVEIDESSWISNDTTYNGGFYFSFEVQEVTLYLIL